MKSRILLADDHKLFREGIENLISQTPDMEVVAQASNGAEALKSAIQTSPDIIILDIAMPVMSGLEIMPALFQQLPAIKVIILSMHSEQEYVKKALEVGAHAYLFKSCTYQQLIEAIHSVSEGKHYLTENILDNLIQNYLNPTPEHLLKKKETPTLTKRESSVLKRLAEGKSLKEVAEELCISIKTVGTHKSHILEKLNLKTMTDLIRYAIKEEIIPL